MPSHALSLLLVLLCLCAGLAAAPAEAAPAEPVVVVAVDIAPGEPGEPNDSIAAPPPLALPPGPAPARRADAPRVAATPWLESPLRPPRVR